MKNSSSTKKNLPIGRSDFIRLRQNNSIYIDKTALLYELLSSDFNNIFLARPRRFGKSLLVSTLATLFRDGLQWFEGLAIANLWREKQYKVLTLDFSRASDARSEKEFLDDFRIMLNESFKKCGFRFQIAEGSYPIEGFGRFLASRKSLVLLIDEYDAPLNNHIDNIVLFEEIRKHLSKFYKLIKGADFAFRLIFITGILKFSHTSLFSAFNDIVDISMDTKYSTLLGYTEEEIESYFDHYITRAAEAVDIEEVHIDAKEQKKKVLLKEMKKMYDGYCFDENGRTHVYCPWSVLSFLARPEKGLQYYWYETGGRLTLIMKKRKDIQKFIIKRSNNNFKMPLKLLQISSNPTSIDDSTLLFYTGYLTIESISNGEVSLKYPNHEVQYALTEFLLQEIFHNTVFSSKEICDALYTGNPNGIVRFLNKKFLTMDYSYYPVRDAALCRSFVQFILDDKNLSPLVEKHNALGPSDMEVSCGTFLWIFEFKFLADKKIKNPKERAAKLDELLQQAIDQGQKKRYGEEENCQNLRRLCLVFSQKTRAFARWKLDSSTLPPA